MRRWTIVLATLILSLGAAGAAEASHIAVIYDNTGDAATGTPFTGTGLHPEDLINGATPNPGAASFETPGYTGSISSLTLGLECWFTSCGYTSGTDALKTAAANTNTLSLTSVAGLAVGDMIESNNNGNIAANRVYITGITGTSITLSGNVTATLGTRISYMTLGEVTLSLNANSVPGANLGASANPSSDVPGTTLASISIFDAQLILDSVGQHGSNGTKMLTALSGTPANGTGDVQLITLTNPFGDYLLNGNTYYWIGLDDDTTDPVGSKLGWEYINYPNPGSNSGNLGKGAAGNFWTTQLYASNAACSPKPAPCSFENGQRSGLSGDAYEMEIQYAPEPGAIAILGVGLIGLGLARYRGRCAGR